MNTPSRPPLVLRGGSVFNADEQAFAAGVDVVCDGGRIVAVGRDATVPVGADIIECDGRFVLPGLIDCHVHLSSSGEPGGLTQSMAEPAHLRSLRAARHAEATLQAGFTTVRDLGAPEHLNIHLALAVEQGLVAGPRIRAAGMGVTMTGGHGHGFIAREADGPDEVRKAVREQLRAGATAVKLFATGGVMTPGVDPRSPSLGEDELAAAVDEAHKAFRVAAAHAQGTEGIRNAVLAGVDSIEHGVWLDDEIIALMVERGTYMVPTLTAPHHIAHGGEAAGIPGYMVEKAWQVLEDHIASFRAAVNAGVPVAMGTDQGTPLSYPGENAQEIIRMKENGLEPVDALLAATAWASELLQMEEQVGRLREGLLADIIVCDRDPLADLAVLTEPGQPAVVIKEGALVRPGIPIPGGEA